MKQPQYSPYSIEDQIIILFAAQKGYVEDIRLNRVEDYEKQLLVEMHSNHADLVNELREKKIFTDELTAKLEDAIMKFSDTYRRSGNGVN